MALSVNIFLGIFAICALNMLKSTEAALQGAVVSQESRGYALPGYVQQGYNYAQPGGGPALTKDTRYLLDMNYVNLVDSMASLLAIFNPRNLTTSGTGFNLSGAINGFAGTANYTPPGGIVYPQQQNIYPQANYGYQPQQFAPQQFAPQQFIPQFVPQQTQIQQPQQPQYNAQPLQFQQFQPVPPPAAGILPQQQFQPQNNGQQR